MEEKNELNDIILNKSGSASNNKKIILAVATLGIILIVVIMLMNSLASNSTDNLPQAVLPPEPKTKITQDVQEEPLFEEIEVVEEEVQNNNDLDKIAQRLKKESLSQKETVTKNKVTETSKAKEVVQKPKVQEKQTTKTTPKPTEVASAKQAYFIQVGSFSKYAPNKKFLKSITDKGYTYKYHKVTVNSKTLNKVLVGPFTTEKEARKALRKIKSSIEAGAFLVKL